MKIGDKVGIMSVECIEELLGGGQRLTLRCACGNVRLNTSARLRVHQPNSCGCLVRKKVRSDWHGQILSPEYGIRQRMKARCLRETSPDFKRYGGRGITVCDRWLSFVNFMDDMGRRPSRLYSLDREDNDKGYSPDNCRWATKVQQDNNRRSNREIEFDGRTMTYREWERQLGLPKNRLWDRINTQGWSVHRAMTTPLKKPHAK